MLKKVEVEIIAKVRTTLDIHDDESLDDLQSRDVDIYIHGAGPDGYMNKQDVGANEWEIKVVDNAQDTISKIIKDTAWILKKELPPVGTVCEYRWGQDEKTNWYKVEVICMTMDTRSLGLLKLVWQNTKVVVVLKTFAHCVRHENGLFKKCLKYFMTLQMER
jgi:hypothetical protein